MGRTAGNYFARHKMWWGGFRGDATLTAAWNGFIHHDERQLLVDEVIEPGFVLEGAGGRHRA